MAEQFDMNIYKNALQNGSYAPPQNSVAQNTTSNIVYNSDSVQNPNLVYMTESVNRNNLEYRHFSNNSKDK